MDSVFSFMDKVAWVFFVLFTLGAASSLVIVLWQTFTVMDRMRGQGGWGMKGIRSAIYDCVCAAWIWR